MKYAEFCARTHFSREELLALAHGSLVADPPAEFIRLPAPPLLMIDRVTELDRNGTTGRIVAEQDVDVGAWYFQCHFRGDPVQPGCLGVDAVWQLVGLYCAACGSPGSGRALGCGEVEFFGQIRPHNRVVRYEIDVRRYQNFPGAGAAMTVADARVLVDGEAIYAIKGAKTGMFLGLAYNDYPNRSARGVGGVLERGGA